MKTVLIKFLALVLFGLTVVSLVSAIIPIGIRPFPEVAVSITVLHIILMFVMSVFLVHVAGNAKKDPSDLLKVKSLCEPNKWVWSTFKVILTFVLLSWAGYVFLSIAYILIWLLFRVVDYGAREDYKKYSEDKAP
ncbi:hypothetical protein DRX00_11885 [Salmonella enterica subsp. enterica serovar Gatuni]|nr:hypothetical protein [Salmonella enterica subsp. enterica serovar Gatuni]